ncbi:MAG TPA: hypothetical protein VFL88_07155 [Gemmatimonadales bacterium]|nr:hypothetical protein [Gemmatimonadales bacterium]
MSDVTIDEMREAMQRLGDFLFNGKPLPPCDWGCPPDGHRWPAIPTQTSRFVVYGYFGHTGRCLYVGQTEHLVTRHHQHREAFQPFFFHAKELRILDTADSREDARLLEAKRIKALDPVCNVQHSPTNRPLRRTA